MTDLKSSTAEAFRKAMANFASSVTAITTSEDGKPCGFLATSVCSLSVDPATVLICVNKTASSHDVLLRTRKFTVNLLAAHQQMVAERFVSSRGPDRFLVGRWTLGKTGCPRLNDAAVAFDCNVIAVHDGFTHSIIVGRVEDSNVNDAAACLLWHRRGYAQSAEVEPVPA